MTTIDSESPLVILGRLKRSPRKLALLDAAIGLFAQRGYHAVTIRDIGDEMGMTSASLYRHYPSKEALLADAFDLVSQPLIEALARIRTSDDGPRQRLRAAVEFHAAFAREHRTYLRVYATEARHLGAEHSRSYGINSARYRESWVELLTAAGAADGAREAEHVYLMAMAVLTPGATSLRNAGGDWLAWTSERTMRLLVGSVAR